MLRVSSRLVLGDLPAAVALVRGAEEALRCGIPESWTLVPIGREWQRRVSGVVRFFAVPRGKVANFLSLPIAGCVSLPQGCFERGCSIVEDANLKLRLGVSLPKQPAFCATADGKCRDYSEQGVCLSHGLEALA